MGKLSGITVVDLSQFLPGPMLSVMMADHGARVIKIEPAGGDPTRSQAPFENGHSVWFANLNRGKESVVLDLKTEAGKAALADLIRDADVFLEGFRPGVMQRLGFDYATVRQLNPKIVYCSISAFGQQGALAHHPAHDLAVQALAGFLSVNDAADGTPAVPGAPAADMAAGLTALAAVLMALLGREKTGEGDYIDCAMFDSMLPWCAHTAGGAIAGGPAPVSSRQRSLGGAAFYQVYRTHDDHHVVLGARELKFARNLLSALGRLDLLPFAEAEAGEQEPLIAFLRETFATRTRAEWIEWFADKDVAFAPVLDFREAFDEPHITERGLTIAADGRHHIAPPIRFASDRPWTPGKVPGLGGG
ncbi:CaiB/BaiF CoA-transferase family protein [Novosphingobium sp. Gsoil 351]|uniref:CaiB/BaiF CoA transferase family protein n=1 Tax=Novosphingobium sp. Gsoil 351 TaxID=2675225 RepID=UPI0012B49062|nr:CoA transferase [Novosphingobium sp. Gsoil 351]QGN54447.1 CoA transferase [Novosphingobium sp. Gsoil 351]